MTNEEIVTGLLDNKYFFNTRSKKLKEKQLNCMTVAFDRLPKKHKKLFADTFDNTKKKPSKYKEADYIKAVQVLTKLYLEEVRTYNVNKFGTVVFREAVIKEDINKIIHNYNIYKELMERGVVSVDELDCLTKRDIKLIGNFNDNEYNALMRDIKPYNVFVYDKDN